MISLGRQTHHLTRIRRPSWHGDCESRTFGIANRFLPHFNIPQSASVVHTFVLAMVLYPDVQARARAEINQVVRNDTIPSIDDRASLPYLDAVFHEVLRWHPVVPLGLSAVI
jgi:hypothetical protein